MDGPYSAVFCILCVQTEIVHVPFPRLHTLSLHRLGEGECIFLFPRLARPYCSKRTWREPAAFKIHPPCASNWHQLKVAPLNERSWALLPWAAMTHLNPYYLACSFGLSKGLGHGASKLWPAKVSNPAHGNLIKIFTYNRNHKLWSSSGCNFVVNASVSYNLMYYWKPMLIITVALHHKLKE